MNTDYNLDFRPRSYWGPQDMASYLGSHITGELRRRAAKQDADTWTGPTELLQSTLDEGVRAFRASIHPALMGGEYLPPLRPAEVEIARVTYASVTMDVVSLRARKSKGRIYYALVDEYMEVEPAEFRLIARPAWSKQPLSMRQVISVIDDNDLIDGIRDLDFDGDNIDEIYAFASVSSEFYPELTAYFDELNEDWRIARRQDALAD